MVCDIVLCCNVCVSDLSLCRSDSINIKMTNAALGPLRNCSYQKPLYAEFGIKPRDFVQQRVWKVYAPRCCLTACDQQEEQHELFDRKMYCKVFFQ